MNNKSKKVALVVAVIGFIFIITGVSYAIFSANYIGIKKQQIVVGDNMIFSYDETVNGLSITNSDILSVDNGKTSSKYFDFSVSLQSKTASTLNYYIYLTKDSDNTLDESYVYGYLTDQSDNVLVNPFTIDSLEEHESYERSRYLYGTSITSDNDTLTTHDYRLRVWVSESFSIEDYTNEEDDLTQSIVTSSKVYKFTVNVATGETPTKPQSEGNLANSWKDKTNNEGSYLALYTINTKTLPDTYTYAGETYTLDTSVDVSEQENGNVILGEYKNGNNIIAVIGQDGKVVAPINSSNLFYVSHATTAVNTARSLKVLDVTNLDTSNVTNMYRMFYECNSLTELDLSSFDTSKVTEMGGMFYYDYGLKVLDLTSFDTRQVTNMKSMFYHCTSLVTVIVDCNWQTASSKENWFASVNISDVTSVCSSPNAMLARVWQDYTSNEEDYLALYTYNSKTLPETYIYDDVTYTLSTTIDVSERQNKTVYLGEYKSGSNIIAVIGQDGKVVAPINSSSLFYLSQNTSAVNTTRSLKVLDLSNLDTSYVTNMYRMFYLCNSLTSLDLTNFDTSKVTEMGGMFNSCSSLTSLDLTSFDTTNVTNMKNMFSYCTKLTSVTVGCNFTKATSATDWFKSSGVGNVTSVCTE